MGHDLWSVILIAGLTGWILFSIMLMLKAFPVKDVFVSSAGIRWGIPAVISFFVWIVGMLNA
jgi:hypothetical protein